MEPSCFHQTLVGVGIPVHYERTRFSTQPFTEKQTPLKELFGVAAKLVEPVETISSRGLTCSIWKAKGGFECEQVMSLCLTRRAGLLPEAEDLQRPIDLPVCPLFQTRHCSTVPTRARHARQRRRKQRRGHAPLSSSMRRRAPGSSCTGRPPSSPHSPRPRQKKRRPMQNPPRRR